MQRRVLRQSDPADGKVVHVAALESVLFSKLHALVAHAAVTRYDDGSVRRPGWFTVKTMGALWVVQMKDPDAGAQLPVTGATLDDALCLADLLLTAPDAPWEPDPFLAGPPARGKRKSS